MPDIYNLCHLFYYYLQILLHHTRDTWAHESDLGQRDCWCNEDNDDENLMQVEGMTGFTQAGCKEIPYNYVHHQARIQRLVMRSTHVYCRWLGGLQILCMMKGPTAHRLRVVPARPPYTFSIQII